MTSGHYRDALVLEIDRQLQVMLAREHIMDATSPKSMTITLFEEDEGYLNVLSALRNVALNLRVHDDVPVESERYRLPAELLEHLWKLPIYSSPSSSFIQPEIMLQKETAMCSLHGQGNDILEFISNARIMSSLSTWASQQSSSIVVVHGSSQATKYLRYLSGQVVNHLYVKNCATAYILNNADLRGRFKTLGAGELLRQIACQLLKMITANLTISLLAEILQRFRTASTAKDWFCLLELMMQNITSFFCVIDASVLEDDAKEAGMWIRGFNQMFPRLADSCKTCIKVMITTNRLIEVAEEDCLHVHIESKINRTFPRSSPKLAQKRASTEFSLPVFIPTSTRVDYGNDFRQSVYYQNNSGMKGEEADKWLQSMDRSSENNTVHTSVMFRESISQSLGLQSKEVQASKIEPGTSEIDRMSRHSLEATHTESQRRQEIRVAIICALSWEADAVEVLCDKIHNIHDFGKAPGDSNIYNVVQIGRHKAVILYMPAMGKSNAAASGINCLHSFPNVRLALLTGICGGIPSPYTNAEILLGDVIISDRLVLYDFGRRFPGGFERKDTAFDNARKPLPSITAFLSKLKTRIGSDRLSARMSFYLDWLRNEPRHGQWATYPGITRDISFEATYHHRHHDGECKECCTSARSACAAAREIHCALLGCDRQRTISRKRHEAAMRDPGEMPLVEPFIHFGAYASGDIVMKSAEDRDEIGCREKVIAFEMEGAGIWDNVPTIIVKGVCDYADSHKNKDWQKYAATTAAACVKALLEDWPAQP